jgi:hypothetical protein
MLLVKEGSPVSYVRAFAPWIAFAVIPGTYWKWAALAALALSAAGLIRHARARMPLDAQIMDIGTAVYFAALTALAFADPKTPLHAYTAALASGALGLIALVSLAAGKPFTLGIAKQSIPREAWGNPLFLRVNMIITGVWAASLVAGCAALVLLAHSSPAARLTVQIAAFVIPMVFTVRYATHARNKAKAAHQAMSHYAA